jgi:hypothetical protein
MCLIQQASVLPMAALRCILGSPRLCPPFALILNWFQRRTRICNLFKIIFGKSKIYLVFILFLFLKVKVLLAILLFINIKFLLFHCLLFFQRIIFYKFLLYFWIPVLLRLIFLYVKFRKTSTRWLWFYFKVLLNILIILIFWS